MTPDQVLQIGKALGVYAFMTTQWGWPIVEWLHFVALSILLGSVGLFDLRVLGLVRQAPLAALHRLVPLGVGAFGVNVVTGAMFILTRPDQYLYNPAFRIKLGLIALAGVNVVLFYRTAGRTVLDGRQDQHTTMAAKVFAAVSLTAWLSVIAVGRVITLYRPPYHWCVFCQG